MLGWGINFIRLCNACGLRWSRNNINLKKKKGSGSYEDQLFAKFTIRKRPEERFFYI